MVVNDRKSTRTRKTKAGCLQKKILQNEKLRLTIIMTNYSRLEKSFFFFQKIVVFFAKSWAR